jgi:hypothetical protein
MGRRAVYEIKGTQSQTHFFLRNLFDFCNPQASIHTSLQAHVASPQAYRVGVLRARDDGLATLLSRDGIEGHHRCHRERSAIAWCPELCTCEPGCAPSDWLHSHGLCPGLTDHGHLFR